MFAAVLIPLLIAESLILLNYCKKDKNSTEDPTDLDLLLGEYILYGIIFSLYTVSVSGGISFSRVSSGTGGNTISLILLSAFAVTYIVYMFLLLKKP
jgi:uncharacterized membrane protein YedE/YeeE